MSGDSRPSDAPSTVLVVVLNRTASSPDVIQKILENRRDYAHEHGMLCPEVLLEKDRQG